MVDMAMTQPRHGSPYERDSPSPVPQPQMTKRDVRRNRMVEKLQQMMDSFNANQHQHYRAQLQAVQVDMNLILRADPYEGIPLEDGGDEIRSLVEGMGANMPGDDSAQRDYWAMAGNRYRTFVREANDAIENRDADLTALHVGRRRPWTTDTNADSNTEPIPGFGRRSRSLDPAENPPSRGRAQSIGQSDPTKAYYHNYQEAAAAVARQGATGHRG